MADSGKSTGTLAIDKILPNDKRVSHEFAEVNGRKWHYLDAVPPAGKQRGTVVLVHGFPDLSFAWRYQIPVLIGLNLRCIAIDCMGYGETGTSDRLSDFGYKSHADAIAGIAQHVGASKIILGGHDWGGAVVYRTAQWYPNLVSHVFSIATPYFPTSDTFVPVEAVAARLPQFGYQLQWGSEDQKVEKVVQGEEKVRQFLNAIYGGQPKSGKPLITPETGIDLARLDEETGKTPLLSDEELDYYVTGFVRNGIHGPCNWYRTRAVNYEDEKALPAENRKGLQQPTLFVQANYDSILTPALSIGMEDRVPNLTRGEVPSSHWALWHTPRETNDIIKSWFEGVVFGGKAKI